MRILQVLGKAMEPDDIIVTVDDDRFYKNRWARVTLEHANAFPYAIVSHGGKDSFGPSTAELGVLMSPPAVRGKEWHWAGFNNRLQGFAGVAYRRKFITDEWFHPEKITDKHQACVWEDDTWFSMMAYYGGIPIWVPGEQPNVDSPHAWTQDMKTGLSDKRDAGTPHERIRNCEAAVIEKKKGVKIDVSSIPWDPSIINITLAKTKQR